MTAKTLMVQGTSSAVGKSILVAALCRIFFRRGLKVAPFKAQNLALNAAVTPEGGEIGRSQALQAQACGREPTEDMNPVLLKPEDGGRMQVVLRGRSWKSLGPGQGEECQPLLWSSVIESLDRLSKTNDLLLIEGAGSPTEINLKAHDIVNMRVACHLGAPVLLAASIELGGVFASLLGTLALLEPEERALVRGFLINRFHGEPSLLAPGLRMLEERAGGVPTLGVIPFIEDLRLPQEDSAGFTPERERRASTGRAFSGHAQALDIAVIRLPFMSNFDDCDALSQEPGTNVRFVSTVAEMGDADAVLIPGSKATLADLAWLSAQGFPRAVRTLAEKGRSIVGICGGYQMLGLQVRDPRGVEGATGAQRGLGLLPVETDLASEKTTRRVSARAMGGPGFFGQCRGMEVVGYEIHRGRTAPTVEGPALFTCADGTPDGAAARDGAVWGTYIHGIFDAPGFRRAWLKSLTEKKERSQGGAVASAAAGRTERLGPGENQRDVTEREIDRLADIVEASLDMDRLRTIVGL
jgi:adenosylcobyric acid synthase